MARMPTHIRALIVVIVLATFCFTIVARPAKNIIPSADFRRWRNLWLVVTCTAFLAGNFWLFALVSAVFIALHLKLETTPIALYWLLLCAVPPGLHSIPGFGIVNRLFELNMPRLLSLVVLLPVLLHSGKSMGKSHRKNAIPDLLFVLFILLATILSFRQGTLTVGLRTTFVLILVSALPYFAFSRKIQNFRDVKYVMFAYLLPLFILGILGAFEGLRHWKLYDLPEISDKLGYGSRAGTLRASTTTDGPIVFGYIMMIGVGFLLPLANRYLTRVQSFMAFGVLGLGLVSSLSRGPWVGTAALIFVYIVSGRNVIKKLASIGFAGILLLPVLSLTPYWQKIVGLIPFIGSIESENIDYRERLFEQSWIVINQNPWFGSIDYLSTPEMQSMIQGQGIIDLVNTYIQITLEYGFVGLFFFVGFFGFALLNLRRAYKILPDENVEMKQVGRAIFATLCAVLITIGTVSNISFIPYIYWSLAGLAVAYVNIIRNQVATANSVSSITPKATSRN